MKKIETVKEHDDFNTIIRNGHRTKCQYFVLCSMPNKINKTMYGIAVSKKLGNAVMRNKLKRRYRNLIDENKILFEKNQNYIIMIKRESVGAEFQKINESMKQTLKGEK